MPRKSIGDRPMTDAERQARYRTACAAGRPTTRIRRPIDHRSRARRWYDAVAELVTLQAEYEAWLEASTSPTFRRSNRPEGSAGIDAAGVDMADAPRVHQQQPPHHPKAEVGAHIELDSHPRLKGRITCATP
jgi:hypothetical protein